MKVIIVIGARPNFVKAAALEKAIREAGIELFLVHTGQHSDEKMSGIFFGQLGLPRPAYSLNTENTRRLKMIARCMEGLEKVFLEVKPDWVMVLGDVNSSLAGAVAAAKLHLPLAHVEAGLRSFDRRMPEEMNRIAIDALSDLFFATEPTALSNLRREGHPETSMHLVGNVMIDTLDRFLPAAQHRQTAAEFGLNRRSYGLLTLHRPANVDEADDLREVLRNIEQCARHTPILFPLHPRTSASMESAGVLDLFSAIPGLHMVEPLGYLDFLSLMYDARFVLTDSGGIQEETSVLGIPCLTIRDNTERPVTVEEGTNRLVGARGRRIGAELEAVLTTSAFESRRPELWDGHAAGRIASVLLENKGVRPQADAFKDRL